MMKNFLEGIRVCRDFQHLSINQYVENEDPANTKMQIIVRKDYGTIGDFLSIVEDGVNGMLEISEFGQDGCLREVGLYSVEELNQRIERFVNAGKIERGDK